MGAGKTFQIYIPGTLVDSFTQRAKDEAKENESAYVQDLHRKHISESATAAATNAAMLVDLAKVFHPTLAPALALQLNNHPKSARPVNQPRVIARILEALTRALEADFDPEAELAIVDKAMASAWEKISDERMLSAATHLATLLNKDGAARLIAQGVNEDSASYPAEPARHSIKSPGDESLEREKRRRAAKAKSGGDLPKPPHTPREPAR